MRNQIKKKGEKNVIKLIRKSNELVEARYKFDIWETRVFTKMLTMVRRDDGDFKNYRIYLRDVIKEYNLENNNDAYDRLRGGAMKLMSKIVKVVRNTDEGLKELNTPIVVGVENLIEPSKKVEDAKFIDVSFHPGMKPFILSLQSHFTTYDVNNILKLPSSYSIRIYELLKQYQKIGKRKFTVEELKEIIGVIEEIDVNGKKQFKDNYPLYGNFRQRVLEKAKKDLAKHTDINFDYDPIKRGRAVREILFYIYENEPVVPFATKKKKSVLVNNDTLLNEIHEEVKEWVSLGTVRNWLKKYPEQQVRKGIKYTLDQIAKGKEIENVGGYLSKMVQEESLIEIKSSKTKKNKEIKAKKVAIAKKKKELQLQEIQLREELKQKEGAIIQALFIEQPSLQAVIFEELKTSKMSGYNLEKDIEGNMADAQFRGAFKLSIRKRFGERFKALDEYYVPRLKKIKSSILSL